MCQKTRGHRTVPCPTSIYKVSDRNASGESKYRTTQIAEEYIGNDVYLYGYDVLGNITSIKKAERTTAGSNETSHTTAQDYVTYSYDDLGQLTEEKFLNKETRKTWLYDELGNITNRNEYKYVTVTDPETNTETEKEIVGKSVVYTYTTDNKSTVGWNNLLTSVKTVEYEDDETEKSSVTETITYDQIGNPTSYLGASLKWNGRELTSYTEGATSISYKYDADGLRTSKTVNGVTSKYFYVNGQLHYEELSDGTKLYFFYDSNGYLTGIEYNNTMYYPATNKRGDVVAIYNSVGNCIVKYEYDAWGNVIGVVDNSGINLAEINPIRYRGYYYDVETKFYYLQSRYYNPEVGRFLNADSQLNQQSGPLGFNMFAYAENNPIMFSDPTGHSIILACLIGGAIIGAITGGAIGASVSKIETGKVSAKAVIGGALAGAVIGGAVGAALGYVGQAVASAISASTGSVNSTTSISKTVAKGAQNPKVKAAIEKGKLMHKQMDYGPGVLKEQTIAPGCRVDGIDFNNRIIYELKPNNPQAIARGMNQLNRYTSAASQKFGGTWTGVLKLYD